MISRTPISPGSPSTSSLIFASLYYSIFRRQSSSSGLHWPSRSSNPCTFSAHVFIPLTTSSQRMICCFVVHVRPKFRHLHPRHIMRCPGGLIGCAQAKRRVQPRPQRTARAATVAVHPCQSSQAPVHVLAWATAHFCTDVGTWIAKFSRPIS